MNSLVRGIAYCFLMLPNVLVVQAGQDLFGTSGGATALSFVLYVLVLFAVVFVHESGHVAAALYLGWRVTIFAVFPFAYRTKTKSWEFWVSPSGDLGGMVGIITNGNAKTRRRSMLLSAAGPLANFAFAAVALCMVYLLPVAQTIAGSIAISSLFVGLGNLLPWKSRNGAKSDGEAIFSALRSRKLSPT